MKHYVEPLVALIVVAIALAFSGCASSQQKAVIMPGAELNLLKKFYVVHLTTDDRNVNSLIRDDLVRRGFEVSTGEASSTPENVDATITYQDKWMWDMTMYMIQLDIQIRKPKSDIPIATGQSLRTSLVRRSPPEMVKEVLDTIYQKAGVSTAPALGK